MARKWIISAMAGLVLAALGAQSWAASVPAEMTYQGRLKESGSLVTGTRSVDIWLCNVLSGGTDGVNCFSASGAQNVSVQNGLFRSTYTLHSSVTLGNPPWYLEVRVGGTPLAPREQLTTTPYAFVSSMTFSVNAADVKSGTLGSGVILSAGQIGTGVLGSGVVLYAGNLGSGTLGTGVYLPANRITAGNLGSGVFLSAGQVGSGVLGSGVSLSPRMGIVGTPQGSGNLSGTGCGAGVAITGNDSIGRVTIGAGPGGSICTLAFTSLWSQTPVCFINPGVSGTGIIAGGATSTSVNFIYAGMNGSGMVAGSQFDYLCFGR